MISIVTFLFTITLAAAHPLLSFAQINFTDVTNNAGVPNSVGNQDQGRLGTGLAWGDYDNDGDLDLYVTNWGSSVSLSFNRLYRNNGNGSFTDIAQTAGVTNNVRNSIDALWGDYDNDGDLDLYVVNFDEQDQLYRNNGNSSFSTVTGNAGVNVISQGDETSATWGDYDNDGDLDLYLCKIRFRNSFYRNNGDGSFSEIGVTSGVADIRDSQAALWGDYDNDGDLDLYVVNKEQNNALYRNNGSNSFSEVACALSIDNTDVGQNGRWIDYDNDGDLDLHLTNIGANSLYRNDGNDQFFNVAEGAMKTTSGSWVSWGAAWGDYDSDGLIDLFVANGAESQTGQINRLLRNIGDDTFISITGESELGTVSSSSMSVGSGDYDSDGDLDLYVINSHFPKFETSRLYRNDSPDGSTIKVRVRRKGAADGIGARVELLLGTQIKGHQQITSGNDALEAIFGVQPSTAYTIKVSFSDRSILSRSGIKAGTTVEIEQQ